MKDERERDCEYTHDVTSKHRINEMMFTYKSPLPIEECLETDFGDDSKLSLSVRYKNDSLRLDPCPGPTGTVSRKWTDVRCASSSRSEPLVGFDMGE